MDLKMLRVQILFFLILLVLPHLVKCQDATPIASFRVIDEVSGYPVVMAHIINRTQREAFVSDLLGYFRMSVAIGDTISISSLGYQKLIIYSWGQYSKDSMFYTVKLKPRDYDLKELKFVWYSTYDKFLKGFKELELHKTREDIDLERIRGYFNRSVNKLSLVDLPKPTAGLGFGKDWLAKQNEKLKEKLEKERIQRLIERKYSTGIVEILTGLKGNEVHWFMEYCGFTEEYLLKASDYEIRQRILDKFKIYNQDKTSKDKK